MAQESLEIEVLKSATFDRWLRRLSDSAARIRVLARIRRLSLGNFGDVRSVCKGVSELRIDYGPGYRVYFMRQGAAVVLLLCAGDKRTQAADIKRARRMVEDLAE